MTVKALHQADTLHRLISCLAAGTYKWEKVDTWPQVSLFFLLYFKFFVFESWEPMTGGDACLSAHAATSSTGEGWHSGVADDGQSSADSSRQEVSREKKH